MLGSRLLHSALDTSTRRIYTHGKSANYQVKSGAHCVTVNTTQCQSCGRIYQSPPPPGVAEIAFFLSSGDLLNRRRQ